MFQKDGSLCWIAVVKWRSLTDFPEIFWNSSLACFTKVSNVKAMQYPSSLLYLPALWVQWAGCQSMSGHKAGVLPRQDANLSQGTHSTGNLEMLCPVSLDCPRTLLKLLRDQNMMWSKYFIHPHDTKQIRCHLIFLICHHKVFAIVFRFLAVVFF